MTSVLSSSVKDLQTQDLHQQHISYSSHNLAKTLRKTSKIAGSKHSHHISLSHIRASPTCSGSSFSSSYQESSNKKELSLTPWDNFYPLLLPPWQLPPASHWVVQHTSPSELQSLLLPFIEIRCCQTISHTSCSWAQILVLQGTLPPSKAHRSSGSQRSRLSYLEE